MNNHIISSLWYMKHRPSSIEDYIFNNPSHEQAVKQFIATKTIPHIMLIGPAGTGKTTLAKILIESCIEQDYLDIDVLKLNASDTNSVDDVRNLIYPHITSACMGLYKIVWLEEAEYLSPNAQGILRDYMEEYQQQCRFIITTNQYHRIIEPIRSRCQQMFFKSAPKEDIALAAAKILLSEKIKPDINILQKHIDIHYPDIRSIINSLESCSSTGVLTLPVNVNDNVESKSHLLDLIENEKWSEMRNVVNLTIADEELEDIYQFLYENIDKAKKFKKQDAWDEAIVLIADHLYRHTSSARPMINFSSLIIQLQHIGK